MPWPVQGHRPLDPDTGDEAGTTEGPFEVHWHGDFYYGTNLAIASSNNHYLDGLGAIPEKASHTPTPPPATTPSSDSDGDSDGSNPPEDADSIYLWMSDYHPDGGQLFWPTEPIPFVVCLGPASAGDDVTPDDMRAFYVEAGCGAYFHPR